MRNQGIDLLRLVAAFCIVVLHVEPHSAVPRHILENAWLCTRFAVPVFFLASGFFLQPRLSEDPAGILRTLAKLAKLFLLACIVYVPWRIGRGTPWEELFTIRLLTAGTAFHLWFLPSLGLGVLIQALEGKRGMGGASLGCSGLIIAAFVLANHFQAPHTQEFELLRFLSGIAFVKIGAMIRKHSLHGAKRTSLFLIALVGMALQLIEFHWIRPLVEPPSWDFQLGLGTVILAIGLFSWAASFECLGSGMLIKMSNFGASCTTGIYVFHVWAITLTKKFYLLFGIPGNLASTLAMPFLVTAICVFSILGMKRTPLPKRFHLI